MNIKVCSVAAVASNGVIGNQGGIPWKLPSDFKWFKQLTLDHVVIMGRKTWDSLPKKPLPKRYNIVVTSKPLNIETDEPFDYTGNVFATSDLTDALSVGMFEARRRRQDKIFVIGGESLYNAYLKLIDRHYITNVIATPQGDTFYPQLSSNDYEMSVVESAPGPGEGDEYNFVVFQFDRIIGALRD